MTEIRWTKQLIHAIRDAAARVATLSALALFVGCAGHGLAWRPGRVFDDGQRVYIQMPATLSASEAPALLVQSRGGDAAL